MSVEDVSDSTRDQLVQWMEAAQKPQPPLTNTELKQIRELLEARKRSAWIKKQIFVLTPWITTVIISIGAGWNWLVGFITGHKVP